MTTPVPVKGFFKLPAELRNLVYFEYLHEHGEATFHPNYRAPRQFTMRGAFALTCRAVYNEWNSWLDLHAKTICFRVHNFDFGRLITALNRLDDKIVAAMAQNDFLATWYDAAGWKKRDPPPLMERRLCAVLVIVGKPDFDPVADFRPLPDLVRRWENRLMHPAKKGALLEVEYVVSSKSKLVKEAMEAYQEFWKEGWRRSMYVRRMVGAVERYARLLEDTDADSEVSWLEQILDRASLDY